MNSGLYIPERCARRRPESENDTPASPHVPSEAPAGIAALIVADASATRVTVQTLEGARYYRFYDADEGRAFEDSILFNNIFGGAVSDALRLCAIRAQMETGGVYDGTKIIDVTAYVHRNDTALPDDYITAEYRLADLLRSVVAPFDAH